MGNPSPVLVDRAHPTLCKVNVGRTCIRSGLESKRISRSATLLQASIGTYDRSGSARIRENLRFRRLEGRLCGTSMAKRGILQLRKLRIQFCDFGGSSTGVRDYLQDSLPALQDTKPHLQVETDMRRGRHPFVVGNYVHGNERVVCLRNKTAEQVKETISYLSNSYGRKVKRIKKRILTTKPSIQGTWNALDQTLVADASDA